MLRILRHVKRLMNCQRMLTGNDLEAAFIKNVWHCNRAEFENFMIIFEKNILGYFPFS